MKKTDSISKRYLFKLITSVLVIPLNLYVVSLFTKSLGPELYGDFKYLIYIFTLLVSVITFGGNYFNTEISKNHYNKNLISFYFNFLIICWVLLLFILIILIYFGAFNSILNDNITISVIWVAFIYSFVSFISQFLESITDSCGLTTKASIFSFISKIFGLLFLIYTFLYLEIINIYSSFSYYYIIGLIISVCFFILLIKNDIPINKFSISMNEFKRQFKPFITYSSPLLILIFFSFFTGVISRSILQQFGGSIEQGYFSFSDSISAFIIIFSNSITPLLLREFSIFYDKKNSIDFKNTFNTSLLFFTGLSSFFCALIFFNVEIITEIIAGNSFKSSFLSTKIMLLYPILYVTNNILNTVLYSMGKTKLMRNIVIIIGILQIIFTFIFVTPVQHFGLNLGAFGFAISLVIVTMLNYLLLLFYCAKLLKFNFIRSILQILRIVFILIFLSFITKVILSYFIENKYYNFAINGFIYSLITIIIFYKFSYYFGVNKSQLDSILKKNKL